MSERVVIDNAALAQLLKGQQGPVFRYVSEVATRVQTRAKAQVGKKTHNLEHSIVKRIYPDSRDGFRIEVGSSESYARVHHDGARPHVIYPKKAKVLVFSVGGRTVFASKVNHPGNRPNKYLTDAARAEGLNVR